MVEKRFNKLGMPDIERFENYLPTAFSSELTLLQKVNKIIQDLIRNFDLTNEMVDYLNNFIETFDEKLYQTIEDVLIVWVEDGRLADIVREAINEEVVEARDGLASLSERLKRDKELTEKELDLRIKTTDLEKDYMLDKKDINNYYPRQLDKFNKMYETNRNKMKTKIDDMKKNNYELFGLITDTHYHPDTTFFGDILGGTNIALGNVTNFLSFSEDFIFSIIGGDNIDSTSPDKTYPYGLNQGFSINAFTETKNPLFIFKGNHDDGSFFVSESIVNPNNANNVFFMNQDYSKHILTNSELSTLYKWKENLFSEKRNNGSGYFYYDSENVRLIGLDSYDNPERVIKTLEDVNAHHSQFSYEQLKWLCENALVDVGDKKVVIYTHCPINNTIQPNPAKYTTNHDILLNIIEKFVHGGTVTFGGFSYSFGGNSNLVGVFSGHLHKNIHVVKNNINYIGLTCDLYASGSDNFFGSPMQTEFSVIGINKSEKKVKVTHFSRNGDFETTY